VFCFLEKIELETTACPVRCMYRGKDKTCEYKVLTPDSDEAGSDIHVTAKTVSEVKGIKLYRVKESVSKARLRIKAGLIVLRYAEFLKTLGAGIYTSILSEQKDYLRYKARKEEPSNEHEGMEELLLQEFGLGVEAQQLFFDTKVFKRWATSSNLTLDFSEIISTLMYVVNLRIKETQEQELTRVPPESSLGNNLEDSLISTNDEIEPETETRN
jgi:hypothetical protein